MVHSTLSSFHLKNGFCPWMIRLDIIRQLTPKMANLTIIIIIINQPQLSTIIIIGHLSTVVSHILSQSFKAYINQHPSCISPFHPWLFQEHLADVASVVSPCFTAFRVPSPSLHTFTAQLGRFCRPAQPQRSPASRYAAARHPARRSSRGTAAVLRSRNSEAQQAPEATKPTRTTGSSGGGGWQAVVVAIGGGHGGWEALVVGDPGGHGGGISMGFLSRAGEFP